jgi:nitrogen fixation NifU-like protein
MYEETLIALSRDTRFRLSEAPLDPVSERRNPACGDEIMLVADLTGSRVTDLRFYAQGCAVCVASAAALCEELQGLEQEEALSRIDTALAFFTGTSEWTGGWGGDSIPALGAVRARPMRMACVRLAWDGLKETLDPLHSEAG